MTGTFPRNRLNRKPLVSDPGIHHVTCVTHVPWCISGSLTRWCGVNVPGICGACATCNLANLIRGPLRDDEIKVDMLNISHHCSWFFVLNVICSILGYFYLHMLSLLTICWRYDSVCFEILYHIYLFHRLMLQLLSLITRNIHKYYIHCALITYLHNSEGIQK